MCGSDTERNIFALQVILLRALRGRLCEALAKVHNGAAQLNLAAGSEAARSLSAAAAAAQPCAAGGTGGPAADERDRLFAAARDAALHCVLSVSTVRHPLHTINCLNSP